MVQEAFRVCNDQDLMEGAIKGKRLIKKMQFLAVLIHPPPRGDPEGLDRPQEATWARTNVLLSERGVLAGGKPLEPS